MKWLRRIGIVLGTLVGLVLVAVAAVYAASSRRLTKAYAVTPEPIAIPADSMSLARGRHLATTIGKCTDCHTADLGGRAFIDDAAFGHIVAPNLTRGRGGLGGALTAVDYDRAVRHGVGRDGRPLIFIPASSYRFMSDEDLGALVAYLKTIPPVDREHTPTKYNLLPRALMTFGKLPGPDAEVIDHSVMHVAPVTPDTTVVYGNYLANIGGCTGCHNPTLSGGAVAGPRGTPAAANITTGGNLGKWTKAQFVETLRTGKRPDGYALDPFMPWKLAGQMTDDEMTAVWNYLRSVPAREFGK
ncbi:MAG: c-type cytochrome [Gemmatimonadaceae bacterium]